MANVLNTKNTSFKTLGPRSAHLVTELHERGKTLFSHKDVVNITGMQPQSARTFTASLVNRGIATRVQPGLFILVPFELGREREYLGNPFVIARELAQNHDYFISHASAMDIHRMLTQPRFVVYAVSPRSMRPRTLHGTEFRFIKCRPSHFFGATTHWATKTEQVYVSDLERTVIDGLKQPEYCGGLTEVAGGLLIRREDINPGKLVKYALRMDVGAVIRRLGFLLETYEMASAQQINQLRTKLTPSYTLLDPLLPNEGKTMSRWRLRLNVESDELLGLGST